MADIANPVVYYNGNNITCFPSSNAKDFGKLHTEFNEARFVTRVAKKNFCIKNPSFVLSAAVDIATNQPVLEVSEGEASINGMDIIASVPIQIGPPAAVGKWYVAFKLRRDNLGRDFTIGKYKFIGNVLGDDIVGVERTFRGMDLSYYSERLDEGNEDPDMLYLGSLYWDGSNFFDIEEDPQKYTRIEAEDVGCYIKDPKHADITYMDLQSWIYKVPDWYFSKEGDVCYGEINVVPGRGAHPSPYSDPMPGFTLRAYDANTTKMVIKASSIENATLMRYGDINNDGKIDNTDLTLLNDFLNGTKTPTELQKKLACVSGNREGELTADDAVMIQNYINGIRPENVKGEVDRIGKTGVIYGIGNIEQGIEVLATNSKVEMQMNQAQIYSNFNDDIFHIHNPKGLCLEANNGNIKLEAKNEVIFKRFDANAPTVKLTGNVLQMTDPNTPNLIWKLDFQKDGTKEKLQQTIGKSILQYDLSNKYFSLLGTDTARFDVIPPLYMENATNRCIGTLYFGPEDGNNENYMRRNEIQLDSNTSDNVDLKLTDRYVYLRDENGGSTSSYFKVGGADNNRYVTIFSNGNTEIKNTSGTAEIKFLGNNANNTARIYHNHTDNYIRVSTNLGVDSNIVAGGDGTFNGGDVTIKNQGGTSNLNFTDGTKTVKIYHLNGEDKLHINTNLNMDGKNIENVNDLKAITLHIGTGNNKFVVDKDGNVTTTGNITGKKVYGAVYNDYGEIFRKEADEHIEYGDVVCLGNDGLVHKVSNEEDIFNVIGICSNTMGVQLGGEGIPENEQCEVGLIGKIWTKTDDTEIKPGDHLEPTTYSTVKKADKSRQPFAIAMSEVIDGKVLIFIK